VNDTLRSDVPEQVSCVLPFREVELLETESWPTQKLLQPILLQDGIIVVVQVVHADNFMAFVQKALGHMEADEAGGAG
jgi:hypothetical protein